MLRAKSRRPAVLPTGEVFTSGEVSEISGVSLRQLQWWDEQNVVSPKQDGHRRVYEPHQVVGVVTKAQRGDFQSALVRGKFVMAQRRGVRRVAPLFECGAGRSQLLPTTKAAVNENDVLGVAHGTKDDS